MAISDMLGFDKSGPLGSVDKHVAFRSREVKQDEDAGRSSVLKALQRTVNGGPIVERASTRRTCALCGNVKQRLMLDTSHGGWLKNATLGRDAAGYALGLLPSVRFCANVSCALSLFSFWWFRIPAPIRSLSVCLKYRFPGPVWTLIHTRSSSWEGVWVPRICISV